MLNYSTEEDPIGFNQPQTSYKMYQVEYDQELDQMRHLSLPHTAVHTQRRSTAHEEERRYTASNVASPPVS